MKQVMMYAQANAIDLVDYLERLGFRPQKIRSHDYWYLSPVRVERTASFKVNRKLNLWYDHGIGKGGSLVDFGALYHGCSVTAFLQQLDAGGHDFSSERPALSRDYLPAKEAEKLVVAGVAAITHPQLVAYLCHRKIERDMARTYLKEVTFQLHGKTFTALGFENRRGGFELRNAYFKGSSAPKDVTLIQGRSTAVSVFEGCFSFLSYLSLASKKDVNRGENLEGSFLILNSLSFLEKCRPLMEGYTCIWLYLDRDTAGQKATGQALGWSDKYKDDSSLYKGYKDLNDWLMERKEAKQNLRRGRCP